MHWRKNFDCLLIAFKKLLEKGLNAKLIIIGDGDLKNCLIYWVHHLDIEEFVEFTGTLPYSEITAIFNRSDAYIQSSIAEGFSNSLAEAMAQGLPVFATKVGGTEEIIKDFENGFLLDPAQPENWWEKLMLVENYEKMQAIRSQARKDAIEKFRSKTYAEEFAGFYLNVSESRIKNKSAFLIFSY